MTETLTVHNGIDVDQPLATIDAIKDHPHVASLTGAPSCCQWSWMDY